MSKLATMVVSFGKDGRPNDSFASISETEEKAKERFEMIKRSVAGEGYKNWGSKNRIELVENAKQNGYPLRVYLVAITDEFEA